MRTCSTCQRTYDDNMKFCQADGTPLVNDDIAPLAESDPYKTTLASSSPLDLPPSSPFDEQPRNSAPSYDDLSSPNFTGEPLPKEQPAADYPATSPGGYGTSPNFQEPTSPFGSQQTYNAPDYAPSTPDWTPPPVPQAGWGNQGLGQNTPFSPTPINNIQGQGQNKTLAIVALVCGILSIICCGAFTGIPALITGFMAKNNAEQSPDVYGGRGLALAGMITGGIGTALFVLGLLLNILGLFAGR